MVRTRIAPSPTGEDIHIGNLYTALINYAVAKKQNGQFVIRIEDTDRQRFVAGAEEKILASVKAYGLMYDEGPDKEGPDSPYRQSERLPIYKEHIQILIEKGAAYYCFCSKERLDQIRAEQTKNKQVSRYDKYCLHHGEDAEARIKKGLPYVVRLNVKLNKKIWFDDIIRGKIEFESNNIDDQVLMKSDGFPTYHFAVVVDDHLMHISHIIRAEEWITSTPKHVMLYESFGWELPFFAHVPILRNPDKSKLSKRKNPVWARWYLDEGFLPEAVLNFLSLMGWSHPEGKEIFNLDEFISVFDLRDMQPVGPVFDLTKLRWMNGMYIRATQSEKLVALLYEYNPKLQEIDKQLFSELVVLAQTRMETLKEFETLAQPFMQDVPYTIAEEHKDIAEKAKHALSKLDNWHAETILETLKTIMKEEKIKMSIFYTLFTGSDKGLPLPQALVLLGKEKTLTRLKQ